MTAYRLLLVEDSEFMTERVTSHLEADHGFVVDSVSTVATAQSSLQSTVYDCIIVNHDLPDGTGIDLVESITGEGGRPSVPVVLLSGTPLETLAEAGLNAGVSAFVSKHNDVSESMDIFANRIRLAIEADG